MVRSASFAPHLGAALGAGLMLASALAFNAGARGGEDGVETPPLGLEIEIETASYEASAERSAMAMRTEPVEASLSAAPPPSAPRLAVIVDDVGLDVEAASTLIGLDVPLTLSILPYADAAPLLAEQVRAAGLDVFLHLPMEPIGLDDPGPFALTKRLEPDDMQTRLGWALSRVPGAVGFNNHMGSRLTADPDAMRRLFGLLGGRTDLIFVDSLTHPRSVAADAARSAGLPALRRDVFLDHDPSSDAVSAQIDAAIELAVEQGAAIAIAHPRPETLAQLATLEARAEAAGVRLVRVTELAAMTEDRSG